MVESVLSKVIMNPSKKILLRGIGASAGIITGVTKIILSPFQNQRMEEGNILVTPITNPLLTPSILKAAAIITDAGGLLSHPAMIARELGIPAVVNTKKATKVLKDNMVVTIDGERGIVYVSA